MFTLTTLSKANLAVYINGRERMDSNSYVFKLVITLFSLDFEPAISFWFVLKVHPTTLKEKTAFKKSSKNNCSQKFIEPAKVSFKTNSFHTLSVKKVIKILSKANQLSSKLIFFVFRQCNVYIFRHCKMFYFISVWIVKYKTMSHFEPDVNSLW